jgi:hypothetical protein
MKKIVKEFVLEHSNVFMGIYSVQAFATVASMLFGKTAILVSFVLLIASFVFLAVNDITFSELMDDENLYYIDEYEWVEEPVKTPVNKKPVNNSISNGNSLKNSNIYEFPGNRKTAGKGHHSA